MSGFLWFPNLFLGFLFFCLFFNFVVKVLAYQVYIVMGVTQDEKCGFPNDLMLSGNNILNGNEILWCISYLIVLTILNYLYFKYISFLYLFSTWSTT